MSRPAGRNNTKVPLNPKEQEAKDAANKVNDVYSDEAKFLLRKEIKMLRTSVEDEERMLNFYQQEREKN